MLKYHPAQRDDLNSIPFPRQSGHARSVAAAVARPGRWEPANSFPDLHLTDASEVAQRMLSRMQRQINNLRFLLHEDPTQPPTDGPRAA